MVDLSPTYLGLALRSPLVPSASPLSRSLDVIRHMEDAGAGAVVLHSLLQEQILRRQGHPPLDPYLTRGPGAGEPAPSGAAGAGEALLRYFPADPGYWPDPDAYVEHVRRAKAAVDIPIVASLNGVAAGPWLEYAGRLEPAGADALEVGVYYLPSDPALPGPEVEQLPVDLLREVKARVRIPVAVKLSPYYSNLAGLAQRLASAGADALVLFSRFYQPDVDLQAGTLAPYPTLSTVNTPEALRLPLRWIALLHGRVGCDLAGSGGVHGAPDALKLVLAGASVAMLASELLHHGVDSLRAIQQDLARWLEELGFDSVAAARGTLSQAGVGHPAAFERGQYFRVAADPRYRQTPRRGPDQPVWQAAEEGYRGHLAPAERADTGRRPLNYDPRTAAPPGAVQDDPGPAGAADKG
jgi:dihydroorotate dehydrogenase (fumarate)